MSDPIARLRRIVTTAPAALGDDGVWLADRIGGYLENAHLGQTLDGALGVQPMAFVPPWYEREAIETRTRLIHEMATLFPGKSVSGQAKAIAKAAAEYEAICWPRDSGRTKVPDYHSGTVKALLFQAHRLGVRWPLGWRQIFESLQSRGIPTANQRGLSKDHDQSNRGTPHGEERHSDA